MKRLTNPHAYGLIPVPPLDRFHSDAGEQRLTADKPKPASRKIGRAAALAIVLIAIAASFASVQVSYAIHRHLHP